MFFYKKLQKEKESNKKPLTEEEQNKKDLIKNILTVIVLIIGVCVVVIIANKLKVEISEYNTPMNIQKDVSDVTNGIVPLYKEEEIEDDHRLNFEIENSGLYENVADQIYEDYNTYYEQYNNVYKQNELENYFYIEIYYRLMNSEYYYYIVENKLYVSESQLYNLEDILNLQSEPNKDVDRILDLIKIDIPTQFADFLDYIINLQYYKELNDIDFNIYGNIYLEDGSCQQLSLNDFIEISVILEK